MGKIESEKLFERLEKAEPPLAIISHDKPDPDSMSCAYVLGEKLFGMDYSLITKNGVNRPENQALANFLGVNIEKMNSSEFDEKMDDKFKSISLVDTNFSNLPEGYEEVIEGKYLDKLISIQDHHPKDDKVEELGEDVYVDIRPDLGSTATILTGNMVDLEQDFDSKIATALYHGLYTDTGNMKRSFIGEDIEALSYLEKYIDKNKFGEITGEEYSPETLEIFKRSIENKEVRDQYLISNVGVISSDDIYSIVQSAEFMSKQEGIEVSIISGIDKDNAMVQIKSRAMGPKNNAGDILERAYDDFPGSNAGGHKEAAGGSVPLGIFRYGLDDKDFEDLVFLSINRAGWDAVGKY